MITLFISQVPLVWAIKFRIVCGKLLLECKNLDHSSQVHGPGGWLRSRESENQTLWILGLPSVSQPSLAICPPRSGTSVGGLPSEGAEHWRGWGLAQPSGLGLLTPTGWLAGEGPRPHLSLSLETMDGINQNTSETCIKNARQGRLRRKMTF